MNAIITSITDNGSGTRVFALASADGTPLPAYAPGAHLDLHLGNGLVRQYSLCCRQPGPDSYRIAVKLEPGSRGGSAWLHTQAREGSTIAIGSPRNAFGLVDTELPQLLLAGGIGITPLLSMAHALAAQGKPFVLACFAREASMLVLRDELDALGAELHLGLDGTATAGAVTALLARYRTAHVYTCGPAPFMQVVNELATARFGPAHFHQESFSAPQAVAGDQGFMLRLRDGREIPVAADRSALSCLQDAGIAVDCSCEVGVCGTCRSRVLSGEVDHRDSYLSDDERAAGWFTPCVSRARSAVLVIELP